MTPAVKWTNMFVNWCHILLVLQSHISNVMCKERGLADALLINEESSKSVSTPPEDGCWVFHHMVKSGGTTVRGLLKLFKQRNGVRQMRYANEEWMQGAQGTRSADEFFRTGQGIIDGGYVEALRVTENNRNNCKWFTVFRHPVSRLVSAFYYCKYMHRRMCARFGFDLDSLTLVTFAELWGNYGLRQYALGFISTEDVLASPAARSCGSCPGWYIVKRYLQDLQQQTHDDTAEAASTDEHILFTFLEPTLEIISSRYTVVGVLEDMNTTMRLLDSALGMNQFNWTAENQKLGIKNQDAGHKDEEHAAIRAASTDPAIIRFISLDIALYEFAMRVHEKQVEQYGVEKNN